MEFESKKFKRMFPHLAEELDQQSMTLNSIFSKDEGQERETRLTEILRGYNPEVLDFLRRCNTLEEANEIIDYMEKQHQLSNEYAKKLRRQLKEKGVRSFGTKKDGYYNLKRNT